MRRKRSRFYVGQCVTFTAFVRPAYDEGRRFMQRIPLPKAVTGWIVGVSFRAEGHMHYGSRTFIEWEPDYLTEIKYVKLWKVLTESMSQKPVEVMDEDIDAFNIYPHSKFPRPSPYLRLKYSKPPSERDRKLLSEDSKSWPRDAKGRWTKDPSYTPVRVVTANEGGSQ